MKRVLQVTTLLCCIVISGFSAAPKSGTIQKNFQFKDLDGNEYDLFEQLDSGKYIFMHSTFNT